MVFKNICTKKVYTQNGQEKAKWSVVGTLKEMDDGKQFIELGIFPNTAFYVLAQKEKEAVKKPVPEVDLGQDYEPGVDL